MAKRKILRQRTTSVSFSPILKIWHRCLPWGVDVQEQFLKVEQVSCHGNGILWQKVGKNLAVAYSTWVFHQFS